MSEYINEDAVAVKDESAQNKRPRRLPFTKKQQRTLKRYRTAIMVEVVVIVVLVALRWFVGGWWIDWNTRTAGQSGAQQGSSSQSSSDSSTEPEDATQETLSGGFNVPEFDPEAKPGTPVVDENLGWAVLQISEGYTVHVCGILNADSAGRLPVYFTSDAGNQVWVKLRLLDSNGKTLAESGILKPGEYVENIQLAEGTHSGSVTLQVMGYEPETYYSAGTVGLATNLAVAD